MNREGPRPRGLSSHGRSSHHSEFDAQPNAAHKPASRRIVPGSSYRNQKSADTHGSGVVRILQSADTADQHGEESDPRLYSTAAVTPRVSHHHHHVGASSLVAGPSPSPAAAPSPRKRMAGDGRVSPLFRAESPSKILRQTPHSSVSPGSSGLGATLARHQHSPPQAGAAIQTTMTTERPRRTQHTSAHSGLLQADLANMLPKNPRAPSDSKGPPDVRMASPPPIESNSKPQSSELEDGAAASDGGIGSTSAEDTPMTNAPGAEENKDDVLSNAGEEPPVIAMKKQPDSRPISQYQLAAEVKGIYAGLVLVEAKCVNVIRAQEEALKEAQSGSKSSGSVPYADHWQALTALHRTLLHEHHDFFLASQHPSAAPALRELASKYAMPARMWRHGIHSFLELLRRRLPHSLEYMVAFVYQAYQMMALLYETVPGFEETWIECLGDLARYRFAIEEEDQKTRENWTAVASYWYSKASDKSPKIGRLYHHLAILARTQALYQLSLYCRSLTAVLPFASARESILTLLEPSLTRPMYNNLRQPSPDPWFIRFTALLYTKKAPALINQASANFLHHLDAYFVLNEDWRKKGTYVAVCLIGGLFLFGVTTSSLREIFTSKDATDSQQQQQKTSLDAEAQGAMSIDSGPSKSTTAENAKTEASEAWQLTYNTFSLALGRLGESKVLPHISVLLTFFHSLASTEQGCQVLDNDFPWDRVAKYLNVLLQSSPAAGSESIESPSFPSPSRILPEDYTIREQVWNQYFFPTDFFKDMPGDLDERAMEHGWTVPVRRERVLWLGVRLASVDEAKKQNRRWLTYSSMERAFSVSPHA